MQSKRHGTESGGYEGTDFETVVVPSCNGDGEEYILGIIDTIGGMDFGWYGPKVITEKEWDRQRGIEHGERYSQSPLTGNIYLVTRWEDKGDGQIVAHEKEQISIEDVPPEKRCEYCEQNVTVEYSDQGKGQCMGCSPNKNTPWKGRPEGQDGEPDAK